MAGNITVVKEGSYRLRYKDHSKSVAAKSPREAEKLLAKFITEIENGDFTKASNVTLNIFVEKWLKDYAEVELAPKTVFRYKQLLNYRILPVFGEKKLDKIKPLEVIEFYNTLRKKHKYVTTNKKGEVIKKDAEALAEKTIKHHHTLLSLLFEKAIRWGVIKSMNPLKRVDAPKIEKKKARCYNQSQIQDLFKALENIDPEDLKYKTAIMIAIMTGARSGEVMGLEWQDIDSKARHIEIRQSSQYLPGQGIFTKDPKNETSKRKISANKMLLDIIQQYKDSQLQKEFSCEADNRLFVTVDEKPMHPNTISSWFTKFLKAKGLPSLNFHGLRHTSATFLIGQGMDIQTVAGRLGHSTSATTQNVYSHFLEEKDRLAADMMENAFSGNIIEDKGKKKKRRINSAHLTVLKAKSV